MQYVFQFDLMIFKVNTKPIFVTRKIPPVHHALSDCPLVEGYQME